jgi:hypothetical protein
MSSFEKSRMKKRRTRTRKSPTPTRKMMMGTKAIRSDQF